METVTHEELIAWDKAHVWHPFTPMKQYIASEPVVIRRGRGVKLEDIHGNWYYDGTSSIWLNVHGHAVPEIDAAVRAQLEQVAHTTLLGQANVSSIVLARRLVEVAPEGLSRVFYSDSGATAVEIALKMAIQFWANQGRREKRYILGFTNNYHGDTLGAVSVAPDPLFHWPFLDLLPEHPRVPYPYPYRSPYSDPERCMQASLEAVEAVLRERGHEIAAVIVEPVEGAGGIIPAPEGFLRGLRALCDRYEVLLIVDEVATGFGRTGRMFACEAEGVTPDLLCLGKGITGGYLPLAATLTTERVFEAFLGEVEERKTFFHGHSYTGNPLGCAAALASLELLKRLLPKLPAKAARLKEWLDPLAQHPFVGEVRQAGFMVGIEIVADKATKRSFPYGAEVGYVVARHARARGLLVRPIGGVMIFMPPLAASEVELEEMTAILRAAFTDALPELEALARGAVR
ncbi:adenosylmethionine--8-amino-7-oxononanoate transaminase [Marinithermus hydrothermalis]|uniref:Adenosylmethionine-8-amino-7-oxononanoate aminotransferase n=1 Tax=Marinithermus hydrothermalis (strain DSM 14884 / JCM 11576 / T1) TaxID=869210 RepID=F2NR32_MARHT|nr:adenosylmethionine--8-amino-7-oxononanoate transaminase [Marinithermus hydrothermalis]AEB12610.1 adenosylmethionine-8-amino-7-oxononanoate aminotransferase [Marinithermus hydrothermalis DSM 14884]